MVYNNLMDHEPTSGQTTQNFSAEDIIGDLSRLSKEKKVYSWDALLMHYVDIEPKDPQFFAQEAESMIEAYNRYPAVEDPLYGNKSYERRGMHIAMFNKFFADRLTVDQLNQLREFYEGMKAKSAILTEFDKQSSELDFALAKYFTKPIGEFSVWTPKPFEFDLANIVLNLNTYKSVQRMQRQIEQTGDSLLVAELFKIPQSPMYGVWMSNNGKRFDIAKVQPPELETQ